MDNIDSLKVKEKQLRERLNKIRWALDKLEAGFSSGRASNAAMNKYADLHDERVEVLNAFNEVQLRLEEFENAKKENFEED